MQNYFDQLERVKYEGPETSNPLAFRHYNPDQKVPGSSRAMRWRLPPVRQTWRLSFFIN